MIDEADGLIALDEKSGVLLEKYGRTFDKGAELFQEGDVGHEMYLIQEGEVRIVKMIRGEEKPLATLKPGDFFGEMAIVNKQPRSANAIANTDLKCIVIDSKVFETILKNHTSVAFQIIKKLCHRLRAAGLMIENFMLKDDYSKITNSMVRFLEMGKFAKPEGIKVHDLAVHAAIGDDIAEKYLKRLIDLDIVSLNEKDSKVEILNIERLKRIQRYLEMREEFLTFDHLEDDESSDIASRIAFV